MRTFLPALKDFDASAEEVGMTWWQFLFTVLFGLPLAALAGVIVGGSIASLRQRRLRPAVERHRFVPTRTYGGSHASDAFLVRAVGAEVDALRPSDLP